MTDDDERGRGIFTPADREFLRDGADEYSRQAQYERRKAIEDRVRNAFLDFPILFEYMKQEQREQVYAKLSGAEAADEPLTPTEKPPEAFEVLAALAGIFYEASLPMEIPMNVSFAEGVHSVIEQSAKHLPPGATMRVSVGDIDIEVEKEEDRYPQIDRAIRKLEAGGRLADLEHGELLHYSRYARSVGSFDTEAVARRRREQVDEQAD